ncbi:MAG: endolytic transglycosylase MltG [Lachnospiraceae bacterium]|nr:endolytic transglycosylase MltG [Lachnospiraceae bacterium]
MNLKRAVFGIIDVVCKVVLVVIAVMFIIKAVHYAYDVGEEMFDQKPIAPMDTSVVTVTITGSDSVMDIGKQLEEKKLIKDSKLFWVQERLSVYHDMIGAGTYELSPSMTADEMIQIMAAPTVEAKKNQAAMQEKENTAKSSSDGQAAGEDDPPADEGDDTAGMGNGEADDEPGAETENGEP